MWSGGISNPLSVIEQLTYLLFIKGLDELHTRKEHKAARIGKPIKPIEEPVFTADQDRRSALRPQSHAGALEPLSDQSLASHPHDTGADGQSPGLGISVAHAMQPTHV